MKPCLMPGCRYLVGTGQSWCQAHDDHEPFRGRNWRPLPPDWQDRKTRTLRRAFGRCANCGATATTADHIIPRAAGGSDDDDNLQALCDPCHAVKTEQDRQAGIARYRQLP